MVITNFKVNPNVKCKHNFVAFGSPPVTRQCIWCGMIKIHLGWLLMKIREDEEKEKLREEAQAALKAGVKDEGAKQNKNDPSPSRG